MNGGTLIFLLLLVGVPLLMLFMHRGSHAHGGAGGGCCGGHAHGHDDQKSDDRAGTDKKSLLGTPGPHNHEPAPSTSGKHKGC